MYDLRLWANYTGLQSLLRLTDGGYQQFLVKNLATINFFAGSFAEIAAISALGEEAYICMLFDFTKDYIEVHKRFAHNKALLPLFVRVRIYRHLGLLNEQVNFISLREPISFVT